MTAGRGFIAVALVIFAAWNPLHGHRPAPTCSAPRVALELQLQARGSQINPFLLDAMPYVLVDRRAGRARQRRRRHAAPEELDRVFETSS